MSNAFVTANDWLTGKLNTTCSSEVTYKRDTTEVTVNAVLAKTEFELDDGSGVIDAVETRDFGILVTDLAAFGEPQRGDQIIEVLEGQTYTRTVATPNKTKPFRHDGYMKMFRIHTWERGR